jgi:hypothetical protein
MRNVTQIAMRRIKVKGGRPVTVKMPLPFGVSVVPKKVIRHRLMHKHEVLLSNKTRSFITSHAWKPDYTLLISKKLVERHKRSAYNIHTKDIRSNLGHVTAFYDYGTEFFCLARSYRSYYVLLVKTTGAGYSLKRQKSSLNEFLHNFTWFDIPVVIKVMTSRKYGRLKSIYLDVATSWEQKTYAKRTI